MDSEDEGERVRYSESQPNVIMFGQATTLDERLEMKENDVEKRRRRVACQHNFFSRALAKSLESQKSQSKRKHLHLSPTFHQFNRLCLYPLRGMSVPVKKPSKRCVKRTRKSCNGKEMCSPSLQAHAEMCVGETTRLATSYT